MQTKFSYRVLKWTMLVGTASSLATACVVTSGNDDGSAGAPDFTFGGENTSTSGKTSAGGNSSTAGKTSTGGSSGSSAGGTSSAGTTTGGKGGDAYVPGLCDADASDPTDPDGVRPTMLPSCDPGADDDPKDPAQACKICMKAKCCSEWKDCYGDTPTTACGWGETKKADGQFDCIVNCFAKNESGETTDTDLLAVCAGKCTNQCDAADNGNVTSATSDLIGCANVEGVCQAECFPFN